MRLKDEDKKLLNLIQEEGMAVARVGKIAKKLGMPISTVNTKLKKFERLGIIKGFCGVLDPEKLGRGFLVYNLSRAALDPKFKVEDVGEKLAKIPEVEEVFFIVGEWDYITKLRVADKEEYTKVIPKVARLITHGKGIMTTKCFKETHKILVK